MLTMGRQCTGSCFSAYIIISLILNVAEFGFNGYFAYLLWNTENARVWFSLVAGLLIIPFVIIELISAILYLHRQGDSEATWSLVLMAVIHAFQLGFYWRHISILTEHFLVMKKKSLSELFLLRLIYSLTSGFPLLLIQTYMFLNESPLPRSWLFCTAMAATLVSSAWSVASYRRQYTSCNTDKLVITWPGTLFRLLWRIGELGARFIALALFASLYKHWIFLVVSLHWVTMCLCVCTSVISSVSGNGCYRVIKGMVAAYVYIFCFININRDNAAFRYTLFYIIMFFENATLCAVWMFMVPEVQSGYRYLLVFITASSFFVCVVAMSVYYKFFHVHSSHVGEEMKHGLSASEDCINCRLSLCAKHGKESQRPFNTGWLSGYDPNLFQEQYYKNLLQDSFADSSQPGDRNSTISTALSNPNFDIRNLESMSEEERRSAISFISSGTYVHRRYFEQQPRLQYDSWSEYSSDSHSIGRDRFSSSGSDTDSVFQNWEGHTREIPSLLTDNWDPVTGNVPQGRRTPLNPDQCHSLLRDDSHNWYSDDGSTGTGRKLDWSRLPVTKLARRKYKPSVGSDTDSCSYAPPKSVARKRDRVVHTRPRKLKIDNNNVNTPAAAIKTKSSDSNKKTDNINRLTGKRNKISRNVNYVNDDTEDVVYMEMRSPVQLSAVYENVAYTDDILCQPEKVFKIKKEDGVNVPWYACSESGDSALPTETFTSSNCAMTDVDNDSHSSIELMI